MKERQKIIIEKKSSLFEKINQIDKALARLTKQKKRRGSKSIKSELKRSYKHHRDTKAHRRL